MQNDRIQGILFDAEMVVRFDILTPQHNQKSIDAFKSFKTFKKFKGKLNKNKIVTESLRYELMQDSHSYTTIRPSLRRTHAKIVREK
jgi:hypothetical protein